MKLNLPIITEAFAHRHRLDSSLPSGMCPVGSMWRTSVKALHLLHIYLAAVLTWDTTIIMREKTTTVAFLLVPRPVCFIQITFSWDAALQIRSSTKNHSQPTVLAYMQLCSAVCRKIMCPYHHCYLTILLIFSTSGPVSQKLWPWLF